MQALRPVSVDAFRYRLSFFWADIRRLIFSRLREAALMSLARRIYALLLERIEKTTFSGRSP